MTADQQQPDPVPLVEGRDFTMEDGRFVLTARYLAARGECCRNSCRNCPWNYGSSAIKKSEV